MTNAVTGITETITSVSTGSSVSVQGTSEVGKILAFLTYFTIILNAMINISKMFVIISRAVACVRTPPPPLQHDHLFVQVIIFLFLAVRLGERFDEAE